MPLLFFIYTPSYTATSLAVLIARFLERWEKEDQGFILSALNVSLPPQCFFRPDAGLPVRSIARRPMSFFMLLNGVSFNHCAVIIKTSSYFLSQSVLTTLFASMPYLIPQFLTNTQSLLKSYLIPNYSISNRYLVISFSQATT